MTVGNLDLLISPDRLAQFISDAIRQSSSENESLRSFKFGDLFQMYFEQHILQHTRGAYKTMSAYKAHVSHFSEWNIGDMNQQEVEQWFHRVGSESGRPTANRCLTVIAAVFNWARRAKHIPAYFVNPCTDIRRYRLQSRKRFLSEAELKQFADALYKTRPVFRDFFLMCLLTGARRSNVAAMKWKDINLEQMLWEIPDTKSGESVVVALTPHAIALLETRQKSCGPSGYVFPGKGKDGHITEPRKAWERLVNKSNITNIRMHDLRRTLASHMAIDGVSSYIIAQALGHADPRSTAVYARLNVSPVRKSMEDVHDKWQKVLQLKKSTTEAVSSSTEKLVQRKALEVRKSKHARNSQSYLEPAQQILVEAKIIQAILSGAQTRKEFYRKLGGRQFSVNCFEMERVLKELVSRGLIERYREEPHWNCWRYRLSGAKKEQAL